ncbi:T-complex protein 1 subunit eta [Galdieria sulphuraria]|uniref:T-complex protein 1 subunit eta n=1 Tax=Galdieria sulphuraria TaxID=130081 RepID=M2X0E5_GALSU|nr:T-complex protein 1 subunit [Galdieria sulphuraria]EME29800.1 T-complex protein 1 subunit [Galdieria sulphuraria]GJD06789.1 T-complex protein 1 subunit eta [Galdieria sulphuraria]|eukprot:XP_005706320.1 T-complex protein 1 subunit [Galdieria sulphuraria]
MAPQILLLKEGTDTSEGKSHLISNINACQAVVDIVRTTLGPRGMDKLIQDDKGKVTVSNDGATILKLLDVVHPAAKMLADIAKSQDAEVGDGTTSVVVFAGELLKNSKEFIEEGVHPQIISKAYRKACELSLQHLNHLAIDIAGKSPEEKQTLLERCAQTCLNSKLIAGKKEMFAKMVVEAVSSLDPDMDIAMVGIKKVQGGSLSDSQLVKGVAFKKTFSYAGFEQQPKKFTNPKIVALNVELELKSEKENAEVRIESTQDYQGIVDAEWSIIYDKLEKIVATGAKVVLSKLAIGDLATQYFADRDIFCAGRVPEEDLKRLMKATGASMQSTVNKLTEDVIGTCEVFEEKQVGNERYNFFTGCPYAKTATFIIRGGSEQFMDETERSLHDAIMVVKRTLKHSKAVPGGGAVEMELSKLLREYARTIHGKSQLLISTFAKSLEIIPRTLCENAGLDATDILNKLRAKHASNLSSVGIDLTTGEICDTWKSMVWEPSLVKMNVLSAATEAACLILQVDETIKNAQSNQGSDSFGAGGLPGGRRGGGAGGRGRGRPF